jgi:hypothetical protein
MRILFSSLVLVLLCLTCGCKSSNRTDSVVTPRTTPKTQYGAAINQAEGLNRANDEHSKALEDAAEE